MSGTQLDPGTPPDPEAKRPAPRRYWQLGDDDKRILYITVVGGLAANIGLVVIVGLGLAVTHLIHRYQHHFGLAAFFISVQVSGTAIALVLDMRSRAMAQEAFAASEEARIRAQLAQLAAGSLPPPRIACLAVE
jgi:hypothetical protein